MKKRIFYSVMALSVVALVFLGVPAYNNMGGDHMVSHQQRYAESPQYDKEQKRFVNHNQTVIDGMKDKVFSLEGISRLLGAKPDLTPDEKLPEEAIDLAAFLDDAHSPNIIWLGHSSFLVRIASKTLLIDPVFENAGPVSFVGQRFQDSVLARKELPPIDYVLISHDHYDHLEASSVKYFADKNARFIVPIGVGVHLQKWGINKDRFSEHDWWQEIKLDDLMITVLPAQHYSGRKGFVANDTLWVSFAIQSAKANLYFSGDSGYGSHFVEIGRRYGPFDIAFLENGQYSQLSREIHMHPEDNVLAFKELNARTLVPVHWGMFALSRHSWYDPTLRITGLAKEHDLQLYIPKLGELMSGRSTYQLRNEG